MKMARVLDYLGTLFKLKRNFARDMAEDAEHPSDQKYFEGRADALDEAAKEVDAAQADLTVPKSAQERATVALSRERERDSERTTH